MSRQRPDFLGQGILLAVTRSVQRFRLGHALLLVGLAVSLMATVACLDWLVPRWTVYSLAVLLVLDALLHAAINRAYTESQVQAWQRVLGLADTVVQQARVEAAIKSKPTKKPAKSLYGPRPPFRVLRPDEEPPKNG